MSPHPIAVSPAWAAAGWTMLHLVWIGAAGGLGVALLRRLLRAARAETCHAVAVACLLALTTAPGILFARLYQPGPLTGSTPATAASITPSARDTVEPAPVPAGDLRRPGVETKAAASRAPVSSRFEPLVGYLPGIWLAGSLVTLTLLATGLVGVERMRRTSRRLEAGAITQQLRLLADSLGVARRVGVAICDRLAAPLLIGVIRPLILLPPAALSGWSIEQVEMALLHELAHIRRHDNLVTLLQRLVESLLFFHPVTWWLSAWVSLERELCCDRLVVEHTGRPHAYARMLAALAGAGPGAQTLALAMAERPLTTRIRRILDKEDRSMKMTLTEGLGLLAAAVVGTTLTLATLAGPPKPVSADAARQALERLTQRVVAVPDGPAEYGVKGEALLEIAEAQVKLGDRAAALATLRLLDGLPKPLPSETGAKFNLRAWQRLGMLTESARVRREAGDLDGARSALGQSARYLDVLDTGAVLFITSVVRGQAQFRGAIEQTGKDLDTPIADEKTSTTVDEETEFVTDATTDLIDQCIALGDMALARTLIHRLIDAVGPLRGLTNATLIGDLGRYLVEAGDTAAGRALIERSRQATLAISNPEPRSFALLSLARTLSASGDLDGALALLPTMTPLMQQAALGQFLETLAAQDHRDLDLGGITIWIGYPFMGPKDPAAARVALPKLAAVARALGDPRVRALYLAMIAPFPAWAGDFTGALATARSIPDLKRSDSPRASDSYHELDKPVTFALIAGVQAKAGNLSAAVATLGEAQALALALEAEDQKLIAQIVIAQKNVAISRRDVATAIITEALPLARTQPEPRRSRVLSMLAEVQVQAGAAVGAARTIDAIREYPGMEKAQALSVLAQWHKQAGDAATSDTLLRRAAACLEAKASFTPPAGKLMGSNDFGRDTFTQFNLEMSAELLARQRVSTKILADLVDVESALRAAKALPAEQRDQALSAIACSLASRGNITRAIDLATSIESPQARLGAIAEVATAIPDGQLRK